MKKTKTGPHTQTRNLLEQAFDKLVETESADKRWLEYSKEYPDTAVRYNGKTYKNGKIYKTSSCWDMA
jgi:hypothetical protein